MVEASSDAGHVTRLLVDCGFRLSQLDQRLARIGLHAADIDAVFVTHEHGDHIGCAKQLGLRDGTPVWMSQGSYAAIGEPDMQGCLRLAHDTETIDLGELCVTPFTVPHDAREPLQLTCSDGQHHLGILTDLGHVTPHVLEHLASCRTVLLECNHDVQMLASSRYHASLKRRVGGSLGHLSNVQATEVVQALRPAQSLWPAALQQVVAAHLSQQNNTPERARAALSEAMGCNPTDIGVADALVGTDWVCV